MAPASIVYLEIPAPDLGKATAFYGDVFGWSIEPSGLGGEPYSMFSAGEGLGGGLDPRLPVSDGGVLIYLKVEDIAATLAVVARAGGEVVREKAAVGGEHGYFAVFRDPNGNRVGLWARA